ncbi:MAG TPA: bifunctional nuclease domain-containing protein [Spirochaetia bacterium]|nr:bifunctional nuclease domain-containing protein [Spirochaetia bacterium]
MKNILHALYISVMATATTRLEIKAIVMHRRTHEPTVILQDTDGVQLIPIPVGAAEAGALIIGMDRDGAHLPLPHDILLDLFAAHRFVPESVLFHFSSEYCTGSLLRYRFRRRRYELEIRPADALTIAVRNALPMFAPTGELERARRPVLPDSLDVFSQDVLLLNHGSIL